MKAVQQGHVDIVKYLLENGAKKGLKNNEGKRAIQLTNNNEIKSLLR